MRYPEGMVSSKVKIQIKFEVLVINAVTAGIVISFQMYVKEPLKVVAFVCFGNKNR